MPKKISLEDLFAKPKAPERKVKNFVLSPSDIERVEACAASRVFSGPREDMHPGMWFGIFMHRFLEYVTTKGRRDALAYIQRKNKRLYETCKRIKTDQIPADAMAEMTLAINMTDKTADAIEFDMAEPETHIAVRADLVHLDESDGIWEVWDYKTGNKGVEESGYEKVVAKGNVQLKTGALALCLMHDLPAVRGVIATIDTKTGDLIPDRRLYSRKHLMKHFDRLNLALLNTLETRAEYIEEEIEPDIAPSPERCRACRAKLVCHGAALAVGK